jgi:Phage tail assembly chaperone protein
MQVIHFHKITGKISAWGTGESDSSHFQDHEIVRLDVENVDPSRHMIVGGALVERSEEEIAESNRPSMQQVANAIAGELAASDSFMVPDRPLTNAVRASWVAYRQALRDLSKLPTPAAMILAWPPHPDGTDVASELRKRI